MWIFIWPWVHSALAAEQAASREGRRSCSKSPEQSWYLRTMLKIMAQGNQQAGKPYWLWLHRKQWGGKAKFAKWMRKNLVGMGFLFFLFFFFFLIKFLRMFCKQWSTEEIVECVFKNSAWLGKAAAVQVALKLVNDGHGSITSCPIHLQSSTDIRVLIPFTGPNFPPALAHCNKCN